jgi:hypothetical protein
LRVAMTTEMLGDDTRHLADVQGGR